MYEQRVNERAINGAHEEPQIERYQEQQRSILNQLRETSPEGPEQPKERTLTRQQILQEWPIQIKFLSMGCVVSVGCKDVAFTSPEEAMAAVDAYVADPETVGKVWREQFNM